LGVAVTDPGDALHEAAHATIGKIVGLRIKRASINPPRVTTLHHRDDEDAPWRHGTTALAATIIEADPQRCAGDEQRAYACAKEIALGSMAFDETFAGLDAATTAIVDEMREIAGRLVAEHSETIGVVAAVLARDGELNEAQIDALVVPDAR
jgi:hypothetical protein